ADSSAGWFTGWIPASRRGGGAAYDKKRPRGGGWPGAGAALPIWIEIFKAWIGDRKDQPKFEAPGNIVFVAVDKTTGAAAEGVPGAINEAFIAGTQPGSIR